MHPPDIPIDEEAQFQLEIAWDHGIATHHRADITADRKNKTTLDHQDPESWSLSLEDMADLKRAGLLGP
ncbi:hypothetical protein B296_00025080 [Ensete ventricosum]|uniref:Uncharacterized protein n=1 Tax=Ensete ventricosum TaxID=4639 RepID=A0A426ZWX3_ENSVE|nr:hypothetical protein B296_00025080 [Ensete ventricosum]